MYFCIKNTENPKENQIVAMIGRINRKNTIIKIYNLCISCRKIKKIRRSVTLSGPRSSNLIPHERSEWVRNIACVKEKTSEKNLGQYLHFFKKSADSSGILAIFIGLFFFGGGAHGSPFVQFIRALARAFFSKTPVLDPRESDWANKSIQWLAQTSKMWGGWMDHTMWQKKDRF